MDVNYFVSKEIMGVGGGGHCCSVEGGHTAVNRATESWSKMHSVCTTGEGQEVKTCFCIRN